MNILNQISNYFLLCVATFVISCGGDDFQNSNPLIQNQTFSIDENSEKNSIIGRVAASDIDSNQSLFFTIDNGNLDDVFQIDSETGQITVNNSEKLDFEVLNLYELSVTVLDNDPNPLSNTAVITINIINIEETALIKPGSASGKDAQVWSFDNQDRGTNRSDIVAYEWTFQGNHATKYGLIDFDLAFIPDVAAINKATLKLFHDAASFDTGHSQLSGSNELIVQRLTTDWSESVAWGDTPLSSNLNEVSVPASNSETENYEIDVTTLIQDYISNPQNSYGLIFKIATEEPFRSVTFASSDHENSALHPELIVTYK